MSTKEGKPTLGCFRSARTRSSSKHWNSTAGCWCHSPDVSRILEEQQEEKVATRLVGENKHERKSCWIFSESIQLSANGLPLEEGHSPFLWLHDICIMNFLNSLSESSKNKAPPGKI